MKKAIISSALFLTPTISHAAFEGIEDWAEGLRVVVDIAIPLAFALALLAFFYGIAKYIFRIGGDADAAEDGKRIMLWGIIALFVIASVWGIVQFLRDELDVSNTDSTTAPRII